MRAETNIFNLKKALTFGVKDKESEYKNYRLISNITHCGIGGSYWIITVLDRYNSVLGSFYNDSYIETETEAKHFVDKLIAQK